ncbi:hypothetical protein HDU98_003175 [Podochytrium sp. JEL0797]|nr:hypothetical protein HDU98_003175 [Podochytrium sp. JEL0797]
MGRSGSSINDKGSVTSRGVGGGNSSVGGFYYSVKSRAKAAWRLEKLFEVVFGEVCVLAGEGVLDTWVEVGGGVAGELARRVRNDLLKKYIVPDPTPDVNHHAQLYGLDTPQGRTILNLFLCLFDMLESVRYRPAHNPPHHRHGGYSSRVSASSSNRHASVSHTPTFTSHTYTRPSYTPKEGDLSVTEGFDLHHCDKLDACMAGVIAGVKNGRVIQFLIKTVLVDHEVGVGRRTRRAVVEGMRGVNGGMKGKVRLE